MSIPVHIKGQDQREKNQKIVGRFFHIWAGTMKMR